MLIRQAKISDAPIIKVLLAQLGYPDLRESAVAEKIKAHSEIPYSLLVADIKNQVVGFIALHWFELMHWEGKMGRISAFCVDENFRSKGVGKKLLDEAEKLLWSKGCAKIEVTSNARRTRTHEFYLRLGYKEDSRRFVKLRV
jgi:N-acetylglutamate synthase-like GNAT family acetyltransferase